MNADNPVNISRTLCSYRGALSNYHIPLHCRTGFLFVILMVLYTYRFFSSSVHLVLRQLLATQPHELSKMLFTAARLIACSGVAGIWIANSWSEQRGGIERAGLWPLSHFRKLCWLQRIVLVTLVTLKKKKKASLFAKMGAAPPVGERWFWGGCWAFRLPWVLSTLVLFFPPALFPQNHGAGNPWV